MSLLRVVAIGGLLALLSGCAVISYNVRPESAWAASRPSARKGGRLQYAVNKAPFLSWDGDEDVKRFLKESAVFDEAVPASEPSKSGVHVQVNISDIDPSTRALIWAYIASGLLFVLPAYMGSGGLQVRYAVTVDGQKRKVYEYEVTRKLFAWLPLLPFIWLNFVTDSVTDALKAVTWQFFDDALRDGAFDAAPPPLPEFES
jgi:hypothetical protein